MADKHDCDQCRRANRRFGREPPCDECLPDLMPENATPFQIYGIVCNQVILSPNGPIDLDIKALDVAMGWYDVKDRKLMGEYVLNIFRKILAEGRRERRLKDMHNG